MLLSANAFNLDQSTILSFGKRLFCHIVTLLTDEALRQAAAELKAEGISVENMDLDTSETKKQKIKEEKKGEVGKSTETGKKNGDGNEIDSKDGLPAVSNKNPVMLLNEKRKG